MKMVICIFTVMSEVTNMQNVYVCPHVLLSLAEGVIVDLYTTTGYTIPESIRNHTHMG